MRDAVPGVRGALFMLRMCIEARYPEARLWDGRMAYLQALSQTAMQSFSLFYRWTLLLDKRTLVTCAGTPLPPPSLSLERVFSLSCVYLLE